MSLRFQLVVCLGLFAGCGSKSPPASSPPVSGTGPSTTTGETEPATARSAAEAVAAGMDLLEDIGGAITGLEGCDARASGLHAWVQANQERMASVGEQLQQYPEDEVVAEVDAQMPSRPAVNALFDAVAECASHDGFANEWMSAAKLFEPSAD